MNPSAQKVKEKMESKGIFPSACLLCNGDCAHCSVASQALKDEALHLDTPGARATPEPAKTLTIKR